MTHEEDCDGLDREIDRFVDALASADPAARVPSCPDWTVLDLTEHLGTVHRWATRLVSERSPTRIPWAGLTDDGDVFDAHWLREGGHALVETLRSADPDEEMWAWGADQHVRFWSRRQLHETFVHRLDLELASGTTSYIDPAVAVMPSRVPREYESRSRHLAPCPRRARHRTISIRSTAPAGSGVCFSRSDGYDFVDTDEEPDANRSRRRGADGGPSTPRSQRFRRHGAGDPSLAEYWLAQTAFL